MSVRLAVATAVMMGIVVGASAATTITVGQHGMRFARSSASLAKGDRIIFTNEDDVIHNIHIFSPGNDDSTDLGLQKAGQTLSHRFEKVGAYRVRCNIHPSMRMVVNVN